MTFVFFGKNEYKIRKNILRGVYEENLSIFSRGHPALSRRGSFPLKKILLSAVLCVLAVLVHGQHTGSLFAPKQISDARVPLASLPEPTEPAADRNDATSPLSAAAISAESTLRIDNYRLLPTPGISSESIANNSEFVAFLNNRKGSFSRMLGLKIKTIMIDPGHGGSASGTIGKMGTMEKDVTLDIAKRLKAHLIKSGRYRVLMTREDDSTVPLEKRVSLTQEAKADLFISIHLNYLPRRPTNIIETYYFGPSNDEKTLKLAQQENAGSEYGLSDFKEIMEKLGKTMKLQESKKLAESIQANLFLNSRKHSEDIQDHGVKRAPFVVLLGVDVPAVLAEVSCLSNLEEEEELSSESHRENIARYLAAGIFDYLNKGALSHEAKR